MIKFFLATRNDNKIKEISQILKADLKDIEIKTYLDFPSLKEIEEDGDTIEENSRKKAVLCANFTSMLSIADDTGLEVAYLNGKPGVYSARWAGKNCNYTDNNLKLLKELKGVPFENRKAVFKCVISLAYPKGKVISFLGEVNGFISDKLIGNNGFGYDPLFYLPEYDKTYAQLETEIKNEISHRAIALKKLKDYLKNEFDKN